MKRFDTNVRAFDSSLQERPEVLKAIRVDVVLYVRFSVVYNLVSILTESVIGLQGVGMKFRAGCNVVANLFVKMLLTTATHYRSADFASLTTQQTEYNRFA